MTWGATPPPLPCGRRRRRTRGILLLDEVCYDFSERKFVNAVALCLSWKYLPFNNG